MNRRRAQHDISRTLGTPQNSKFAGGRGRGNNPSLGRRTFIGDLVDMANSSTGAHHQGPSSVQISSVTPRLEASVSMVEKTREVVTPSGVPVDRDRANVVGGGELQVVYHIDEKEVTKEEWLQLQQ